MTKHRNNSRATTAAHGALCLSIPLPPPPCGVPEAEARRFPPHMLDTGGMSVLGQLVLEHLRHEGVPVRVLCTNPVPPRWLEFVRSVPGLRTLVRTLQYCVAALREVPRAKLVHHYAASGIQFFSQTLPLFVICKLCARPLILNYHSGDADRFLRRWKSLVRFPLRYAGRVVVPSAFLQRVFAAHGINAEILPNLAETQRFPLRLRHTFEPRLIVTRNLTPVYGVDTILRAFQIVQRRYPAATLGIAGTGHQAGLLTSLARDLELRNVTFHGVVPNASIASLYDRYDIAVNASRWDNFPGALVEAALSGLAIVSTNAGGISDMIEHGHTGLLVNVDDHEALARAVLDCVEQPESTRRRTVAARAWAEQYSWAQVFPIFERLYGLDEAIPAQGAAEARFTAGTLCN